jgi:two-component system chemotaxis response regulator CheY
MPITALVVDDSPTARQIICYHLRAAGCEVVGEAGDALGGLELFRQLLPEVVTLDLMMPRHFDLDSMALLRTMKEQLPNVAVIVVSVIPFEKIRRDYLQEGVLAYVVKPLTGASFEPARIKLLKTFPALHEVRNRQEPA